MTTVIARLITRTALLAATLLLCACADENEEELFFVTVNGDFEAVERLLGQVDDPNFKNLKGYTPLGAAAQNGYLDIVVLLVEHGARPNYRDAAGRGALYLASFYGHEEVVQFLLHQNASLSQKELNWLAERGLADLPPAISELFLEHGIELPG